MKQQINDYLLQQINPSTTQGFDTNELPTIEYNDNSRQLTLTFPFEKPNDSDVDNFQRPLLRFLKIDMGIPKVKIVYSQAQDIKEVSPLENPKNFESLSDMIAKNSKSSPQFITIASGKGGVGKSQTTVELARALQRKGYKVGIIDADVYGSSIRKIFNTSEMHDNTKQEIKPINVEGFQIASTDMLIEGNKPVIWRGPMLGRLIRNFFEDMEWDPEITHYLIDLPPGTGDVALDLQALLPKGRQILITTPHENASHVAIRAGLMAQSVNTPILGVIENMSYFEDTETGNKYYIFGNTGGETVARELNVPLLERIPISSEESPRNLDVYYDRIISQLF